MTQRQRALIQESFASGMVRSVARHLIPGDGAYDIKNGLLEEDGSIYRRGGSEWVSNAPFGSSGINFLWEGWLEPGKRLLVANNDDFGVLADDGETIITLGGPGLVEPRRAKEIAGLLFIGGGFIYGGSRKAASYNGGTIAVTNGSPTVTGTSTAFLANVDAGMLLQIGSDRLYVVASVQSDTQLTLRDSYAGANASGQAYWAHNLYEITVADPYPASDHYAVAANRLLWTEGDRIVRMTNTMYDASPGPHAFDSDFFHAIPEGVKLLGLEAVGSRVVIFTTGGVWTLAGIAVDLVDYTGAVQQELVPLSRDLILWSDAGIAAWEHALVVPCTNGVYLLDGVSAPVKISGALTPYYEDRIAELVLPGQAAVFRSHYLLPLRGVRSEMLVCRLEGGTGYPWTRLVGHGAKMNALALSPPNEDEEAFLHGVERSSSSRVADLTGYFHPSSEHATDADGSEHELRVITRDFETGSLTINLVRFLRLRYLLTDPDEEDPVIYLDFGDGTRDPNAPVWGDPAGEWGTGFGPLGDSPWTAEEDVQFEPATSGGTAVAAPERDDVDPFRWRIGRKFRYVRFRLRQENAAGECVIRSAELFTRPSKAIRR